MSDYPPQGPPREDYQSPVRTPPRGAEREHIERLCQQAADLLSRAAELARTTGLPDAVQARVAAAFDAADAVANGKAEG